MNGRRTEIRDYYLAERGVAATTEKCRAKRAKNWASWLWRAAHLGPEQQDGMQVLLSDELGLLESTSAPWGLGSRPVIELFKAY